MFFPLSFEFVEFSVIDLIVDSRLIKLLDSGNTFVLCHHFLKVTATLSGSSLLEKLCLSFEYFAESKSRKGYFLLRLEAKMFSK